MPRALARPSRLLVAGAARPDRRDEIATWPTFAAGWPRLQIQQRQTIHRMAELEPDVLGVGHGPPMTTNVADQVRTLTR